MGPLVSHWILAWMYQGQWNINGNKSFKKLSSACAIMFIMQDCFFLVFFSIYDVISEKALFNFFLFWSFLKCVQRILFGFDWQCFNPPVFTPLRFFKSWCILSTSFEYYLNDPEAASAFVSPVEITNGIQKRV